MGLRRPLIVLAAVLAFVAAAFLIPATRDWLDTSVIDPLRLQAGHPAAGEGGYSPASLAFWAALGAPFAWFAYALVFTEWHMRPDRHFFLALAPLLLFGPLYHALLVADAFPAGGVLAYLAAEPLVYLTAGVLAIAGLAAGRAANRPLMGLWGVGIVALAPTLVLAARYSSLPDAGRVAGLLAIAAVTATAATYLALRFVHTTWLGAFAVIAAHALDGATTWLTLRDPFGWNFRPFRESNPFAQRFVDLSNGWPYFAIKLALPVLLLYLIRQDTKATTERTPEALDADARLQAFLLFAVFVLGYGPGMSNLMQVLFG